MNWKFEPNVTVTPFPSADRNDNTLLMPEVAVITTLSMDAWSTRSCDVEPVGVAMSMVDPGTKVVPPVILRNDEGLVRSSLPLKFTPLRKLLPVPAKRRFVPVVVKLPPTTLPPALTIQLPLELSSV